MMHYALVSDLMTREEFAERVAKKSESLGGVVDEVTAAMMVVDDLGRSHVKIGDIPKAEAGIVSFFGKILSIEGPREFQREGEEPGVLATIVFGDPTGTTKTTLWDEQAAAVGELFVGSVVEVIGKPRFGRKEVSFVALRESAVEIVETKKPPTSEELTAPFVVKILHLSPVKEIVKKNGDISYLQEMLVGDESGTTRLVTWSPENFSDVDEGASVSITGVVRKEDDGLVEYIAQDTAVVTPHPTPVSVLTIDAGDVEEGQMPVVTGTVVSTAEVHTFTTRRNVASRVRNIKIRGEDGDILSVALWREEADKLILAGDTVEIINAVAKPSRFSGLELSVGSGSIIRVTAGEEVPAEISGRVVLRSVGLTLENADGVYVLIGQNLPEPGMRVTVSGMLQGVRLQVLEGWIEPADAGSILARFQ
ncbi:MAG: hypothetical protein E7Z72_01560 [Methanocorpusculum parvum]|nr:hypothetical protein [Methanocorpusculum parvum]